MQIISGRGYRFPHEIIQQAIWLYLRFTLSARRRGFVGGTRDHGLLRNGSALGKSFRTRDAAMKTWRMAVAGG
jgi:hypothetical protein